MSVRRVGLLTLLALASLYLTACLVLYFAQDRMLFPAWAVGDAPRLPPRAERLMLDTPDGKRLGGVHLRAAGGAGGDLLLLAFAGNATNAEEEALRLHRIFPEHDVVAFHYRGYAPSTGVPSADAMISDAALIYDEVQRLYHPARVVAVGTSLGSGIAATLAAQRPLAGVVLITPFDSLRNVAAQLYWWLPVGLLMRHDVDAAEALRGSDVPVAIIAAGEDRLVRPERTAALREAVRQLRFGSTLAGAGHNDIAAHPQYGATLRAAVARVAA